MGVTSWEKGENFYELLKADEIVKKSLGEEKLKKIFDFGFYTKNVEQIFAKVFV